MLSKKELRDISSDLVAEPDDYMHSLRRNLYMYIGKKEITLQEVSELADIPLNTLKSLIYGDSRDCHISTVIKLARVFNVSVDELIGCGTISKQTCESLQVMRKLPESFTHFVRWSIHFHYEKLNSHKVSIKSVELMIPEESEDGNHKMTNNFDVIDVSFLSDDIRPKIFMGIKLITPCYMPHYFEDDILLIANDRDAKTTENVIVTIGDNMWLVKRKKEIVDGKVVINYYSIRDGRRFASESEIDMVIGYVAKVMRDMDYDQDKKE